MTPLGDLVAWPRSCRQALVALDAAAASQDTVRMLRVRGSYMTYEAYRAECARHAQAIRRVLETGRPDF